MFGIDRQNKAFLFLAKIRIDIRQFNNFNVMQLSLFGLVINFKHSIAILAIPMPRTDTAIQSAYFVQIYDIISYINIFVSFYLIYFHFV